MKWIEPSIRLLTPIDGEDVLRRVEYACRTCYQSYDRIGEGSAEKLIRGCISRGHESVLEHVQLSFEVVCSRACLAQWTRHRLSSYSVMSQRYCDYTKDKFGGEITCIRPEWWKNVPQKDGEPIDLLDDTDNNDREWLGRWYLFNEGVKFVESRYKFLINRGMKAEDARGLLPNCTATTMVWSANLREIRHFIQVRTTPGAQAEIKRLAYDLIELMKSNGLGLLVEDLVEREESSQT